MSKQNITIVVLVVVVLAAGLWYWLKKESSPDSAAEHGLGAQIFDRAQNPLGEKLPETNPFAADTNPFDAPANPFQAEYKNPFQK